MSPLVQDVLVAVIVIACAAVIARRAYKALRGKKTGCGCDSCPVVKKPR